MMRRRRFLSLAGGAMATLACRGATSHDPNARDNAMPNYAKTEAELMEHSTPAQDGFYLPAEWSPHEYTIMAFPPPQNWRGYGYPYREVQQQWAQVANAISEYEPVLMAVGSAEMRDARRLLNESIELFEVPLNDGWARDTGPVVLVNKQGERRVAGFTFNGWGEKFPPYDDDALLKAHLCAHLDTPMYPIDLVLEGGAIACDGEGTLITTEQCLLNANRNNTNKAKVESLLNESLGTTKVIWLGKGLEPDPITDGHIDGILAYAAPGVVLLHSTDDRNDPNFEICRDAKRRLNDARDAKGRALEVVDIPLTSDELVHMNFYIANGCVVVPTSGRKREDDIPMGIIREVFHDRHVVGIDSTILGAGGGGIHCITQQVPAVNT